MPRLMSAGCELGQTIRLALPIMAAQVGQMLMGITDTLVVGHLGVDALAAAAFANSLLVVLYVFAIGLQTAVSVIGSRRFGAKRETMRAEVLQAGLWLSLLLGLLLALLTLGAEPWLGIFGQAPSVMRQALPYLELMVWSLIPGLGYLGVKTFCDSQAKPMVPMWMLAIGVILNALLNLVLVFGNFGAPRMGLAGSAWATLISRFLVMVSTTFYAIHLVGGNWRVLAPGPRNLELWRLLLRLGLPVGLQYFSEVSAFSFAGIMIGWISPLSLAAHQIAITCAAFAFMFPLGVAQAVSVRIGHALGSKEHLRIRRIGLTGLFLSGSVMAVSAVIFRLGAPAIAKAFTSRAELVAAATQLLFIAGLFQCADGIQVTAAGALRGLSDVRFPMLLGLFSYWGIAIPAGYVSAFYGHFGAAGIWSGLAVALTVYAIVLSCRFLHLTRQNKRFGPLSMGLVKPNAR